MALTEPTLGDPLRPEDAWQQAATRETPFGQYLGEKLLGGLEATRPVSALEEAMLPGRLHGDMATVIGGGTSEFGVQSPGMGVVGPTEGEPMMPKAAWETSPHFRPGLTWDEGMTPARAEALATQHDRINWNNSLIERYQGGKVGEVAGFVAGLAPGVVDPTNYIPLLGPAAKAAMVARLGVIGGNVALHGAEAAANTALLEPLTASHAATFGQPYGWEDAATDIALGALAGSVGGAIHGAWQAHGDRLLGALGYRGSLRQAATRAGVPAVLKSADGLNLALEQLDRGRTVDVAPVLRDEPALQRLAPPETFDVGGIVPRRAGEAAPEGVPAERASAPEAPPEAAARAPGTETKFAPASPEELARRKEIVDALVRDGIMTREELALPEPAPERVRAPEPARPPVPELPEEQARQLLAEEQALAGGRTREERMSAATRARLDEIERLLPIDGEQRFRLGLAETMKRASGRSALMLGQRRGQGGRGVPGDAGGGRPNMATVPPDAPHPSVVEGAKRAGKATPDAVAQFKADAGLAGYEKPLPGHEPKPEPVPGEPAKPEKVPTKEEKAAATAALPPELRDVEHMRAAGDLPEGAEARLGAAEKEAQAHENDATAIETLTGCVMRHVTGGAA